MRSPISALTPSFLILALVVPGALAAQTQTYDYAAAHKYSKTRAGQALLIQIDGKVVFEKYDNGWSQTKSHYLASGTKSFSGFMAMKAVEEGLLTLDEKVADVLTEWKKDTRKSKITYRQLLSLNSGLAGGSGEPSYADAIKAKTIGDPGKVYSYGPNPFQTFGEAMTRKLKAKKMTVADYLSSRLLAPLGMVVDKWEEWKSGEPLLPHGAQLTAREWIKYGEMIRHDGVYGGKRIIKAGLMAECFKRSPAHDNYGLTFWLPVKTNAIPNDCVMAKGSGNQRLYVIPSHRMVIVRFGDSDGWVDSGFIAALMPRVILYGKGTAGKGGHVPTLSTAGEQPKLGNKQFKIVSTNVLGGAPGFLFLSFQSLDVPFLGGKLLINPNLAFVFNWTANGTPGRAGGGVATFKAPLVHKSLLGEQGFLQAAFADSAAVGGISLTPGLFVRVYQ